MPQALTTDDFERTPWIKEQYACLRWFFGAGSGVVAVCFGVVILEHSLGEDFCYSAGNVTWMAAIGGGLWPGVWWLWVRFVGERLRGYSRRARVVWHAAALLGGGWLVVATPVEPPCSWADVVGMGFAALVGSAWLATRPALGDCPRRTPLSCGAAVLVERAGETPATQAGQAGETPAPQDISGQMLKADRKVSRWAWLGYALPAVVYWCYLLRLFWPAIISQDSVFQWNEMTRGKFCDDHPAFHTMINWLITRAWYSPAAIALVQIFALSLVIGLGLAWMRRQGMPRWLAVVTSCMMAAAPANALLAITIWKDIFYGTAVLGLALAMLAIVQTEGQWLTRRLSWLWLAVPAIGTYLLRHNGCLVTVSVLMILPLAYRRQWRPLLLSIAVSAGCIAAVKGPLYWAVGVEPMHNWVKMAPFMHQIAAHVAAKTPLLPEEQALLDRIVPPKEGNRWNYDPISMMPTYQSPGIVLQEAADHVPELAKLSLALMRRRPGVSCEHLKNSSREIWQVRWSPANIATVVFEDHRAMRYDPALLEEPGEKAKFEFVPLGRRLPPGMERCFLPDYHWLVWRPALWMYLFFAGCIVAGLRARSGKYLLVALPIFVQEAGMAALSLSPDFRYHWGAYLAGMLMSGYLLFAVSKRGPGIGDRG